MALRVYASDDALFEMSEIVPVVSVANCHLEIVPAAPFKVRFALPPTQIAALSAVRFPGSVFKTFTATEDVVSTGQVPLDKMAR